MKTKFGWVLVAVGWVGLVGAGLANTLRVSGLALPYQQIELAARHEGVVTAVLVQEGSWVTNGQALVQLDDARELVEMDYAKVVAQKRQADLATAEMLFHEKIFSRSQVEERRLEAKLAEAQARVAEERWRSRTICAPFSGLVVRLYKRPGESVNSLERVAQLADLSRIQVTLYLEADQLGRVRSGQVAEVRSPLWVPNPRQGVVDTVDPLIDPASSQFRVKVIVENSDLRLPTGTRVEVVILETDGDRPDP